MGKQLKRGDLVQLDYKGIVDHWEVTKMRNGQVILRSPHGTLGWIDAKYLKVTDDTDALFEHWFAHASAEVVGMELATPKRGEVTPNTLMAYMGSFEYAMTQTRELISETSDPGNNTERYNYLVRRGLIAADTYYQS